MQLSLRLKPIIKSQSKWDHNISSLILTIHFTMISIRRDLSQHQGYIFAVNLRTTLSRVSHTKITFS